MAGAFLWAAVGRGEMERILAGAGGGGGKAGCFTTFRFCFASGVPPPVKVGIYGNNGNTGETGKFGQTHGTCGLQRD